MVFLDGAWSCVRNPLGSGCGFSAARSSSGGSYRLSRRKWWKRCWLRLNRLRRRKTFPFQSLLLRRRFNRNLSKKEHRHRDSRKTRKNSCQSRAPGPMSMSRAKALAIHAPRPQYPYEARSRHVTGSGVIVATVDAASGNVTSCSVSQALGVLSWITPPLARFGSGDLDLEQFPRLTFPSPSP